MKFSDTNAAADLAFEFKIIAEMIEVISDNMFTVSSDYDVNHLMWMLRDRAREVVSAIESWEGGV